MTKEEAKEIFLNRGFVNGLFDGDKWRQSIVVISEWLEQEPCEDAVSRKAVLEYIEGSEADLWHGSENESVRQDIKELPPVNPQPKTDVLDKIRAEIEKQEKWLLQAGCNTYNVDIAFSSIKSILAESEDKG